jgi:hypothetical protein
MQNGYVAINLYLQADGQFSLASRQRRQYTATNDGAGNLWGLVAMIFPCSQTVQRWIRGNRQSSRQNLKTICANGQSLIHLLLCSNVQRQSVRFRCFHDHTFYMELCYQAIHDGFVYIHGSEVDESLKELLNLSWLYTFADGFQSQTNRPHSMGREVFPRS